MCTQVMFLVSCISPCPGFAFLSMVSLSRGIFLCGRKNSKQHGEASVVLMALIPEEDKISIYYNNYHTETLIGLPWVTCPPLGQTSVGRCKRYPDCPGLYHMPILVGRDWEESV